MHIHVKMLSYSSHSYGNHIVFVENNDHVENILLSMNEVLQFTESESKEVVWWDRAQSMQDWQITDQTECETNLLHKFGYRQEKYRG